MRRTLHVGAQTDIAALRNSFCGRKGVPEADRHARASHILCRIVEMSKTSASSHEP